MIFLFNFFHLYLKINLNKHKNVSFPLKSLEVFNKIV
jgi:hypothetical protein